MTAPSLEGKCLPAVHQRISSDFPPAPLFFGGAIAIFIVVATLAGIHDGRNTRYSQAVLIPDVAPSVADGPGGRAAEVRSGPLAMMVTEVTATASAGDSQLSQAAPGRHLVVGVRVVNDGADAERFEPAIQQLVAGDQVLGADQDASQPLLGADLGPGESVVASIMFDVPDGVEPSAILLRDSPTATGAQVSLSQD